MDKRPRAAADKKQRFDVGITPKEQNGRVQLIDLVCTATSKGKKSNKKAGQAATTAEAAKINYYNRSYVMSPAGPTGDVRGFGMGLGARLARTPSSSWKPLPWRCQQGACLGRTLLG
jgi:hypothetical protein